jgi:phosphoribosylglycinamide formyltransferase 1
VSASREAGSARPSPGGRRVAVLVSGRGSNLQALIDAAGRGELGDVTLALVFSNVPGAAGLGRAETAGIPTVTLAHRGMPREAHEQALLALLSEHRIAVVCLAGYMRLLSPAFVRAFPGPILNVHPSLLPAFPGLDAQAQAFAHGVKVSGATVHIVDEGLDSGPIVAQEAVPVLPGDDASRLAARILEVEHRIYPRALRLVASGRWRLEGRRFLAEESA